MMSNNQASLYDGGGDSIDQRRRMFPYFQQQQQKPVMYGQPMPPMVMPQDPQVSLPTWNQTQANWGIGQGGGQFAATGGVMPAIGGVRGGSAPNGISAASDPGKKGLLGA